MEKINYKNLKKNKTFLFNSFVVFEKYTKKNFILNSEKYLNSIGISIYIWTTSKQDMVSHAMYTSVLNPNKLNNQIEIYGVDVLFDLYRTIIENKNLKHLPPFHFNYNQRHNSKIAFLKYSGKRAPYFGNNIIDKSGQRHSFQICCMTTNILKSAGYTENFPY